jgi:hypothetical protein
MFPLKTNSLPQNAADLALQLNDSLRDLLRLSRDPVTIQEVAYPHLRSLEVALDGARLEGAPPPVPTVGAERSPALTADLFTAKGSGVAVGPAHVDFFLEAKKLQLSRASDVRGNVVLVLQDAAEGRIEVSASPSDIEALIAEVARAEAGKHGVSIDNVHLTLRSNSSRSLAAEVRLRAKKLFLSTTLRITGQVDLDEELNAEVSGLDCTGEGAMGTLACGVLKPHLEKMNGREFSLMSLPLGDVRLRDVRIVAGDKLSVSAEFGTVS